MGMRATSTGVGELDLTAAQVAWFETFGYLVLRGWFAAERAEVSEGFEEVFAREQAAPLDPRNPFHRSREARFEQETRWIIPAIVDKSEKLAWLRHDNRIENIARALLGEGYSYAESDGNLFNCDVYWHLDAYGATATSKHIKIFFYLDALTQDTGALRIIPGSHHKGAYTAALVRQLTREPWRVPERFGVGIDEIPSITVEVEPGDVIVTNFRTLHGSFNGGERRRLFTVNYRAPGAEPA